MIAALEFALAQISDLMMEAWIHGMNISKPTPVFCNIDLGAVP
ncbi:MULTISPECIES: hypothetical protein [unclassified Pseudomonas]|nr:MULTISPECIES: hypothetical protein [unclassified Pseudomonas]